MFLSSKDRKTWVISNNARYFTSQYMKPVGGVIIPAPGTYFRDTKLSKKYIDYMTIHFLDLISDHWFLVDRKRTCVHIACGPGDHRAICNNIQMKRISIVPGDLYICMDCQYDFYLEQERQKNGY